MLCPKHLHPVFLGYALLRLRYNGNTNTTRVQLIGNQTNNEQVAASSKRLSTTTHKDGENVESLMFSKHMHANMFSRPFQLLTAPDSNVEGV